MRRRSVELEQAEGRGDHDGRQGGGGQVEQVGRDSSSRATATAPTTPVSCVFAPAASATGVRDDCC